MIIGGFQKQSLIDYPGKITAVIFTAGCNFRCGFCHNPDLVLPERIVKAPKLSEIKILDYLKQNRKLIDAVTITGGEPTVQKDLIEFIKKLKNLGFLVKLDSNGTNPTIIKTLLENKLIDFIAMDVKAPVLLEKYRKIAGNHLTKKTIIDIKKSIELILKSKIDYDFRTTIIKKDHSKKDIIEICNHIKGSKVYSIQTFNPYIVLDEKYKKETTLEEEEIKKIIIEIEKIIPKVNFR